jgi:RNA polymerase sigma factor (sigma-70 family)
MAASPLSKVVQHLRKIAFLQESVRLSDKQLLQCFLEDREEAAFEALVRRHGPMVLGVCRRVLHNRYDAEDAFQATFLVLLRKAASIRKRELLENWLYGVAHRTAMQARRANARRRAYERRAPDMAHNEVSRDSAVEEMLPHLDEALSRLPDRYRVPIILCDLGGKTRKEAARQLGVPERTLSTRLTRGRAMLAKKLARYGTTLDGGAMLAAVTQNAATSPVPISLVASTVKAATVWTSGQSLAAGGVSGQVVSLTEGVVRTMLLSKMKIAVPVILAVAAVGTGIGAVAHVTFRAGQQGAQEARQQQSDGQQKATQSSSTKRGNVFSVLEEIDFEKQTVKVQGPEQLAPQIPVRPGTEAPAIEDVVPPALVPTTLHVGPTTKIIIDGKEAKFTDLNLAEALLPAPRPYLFVEGKIAANVEYELEPPVPDATSPVGKAIRIKTVTRRRVGVLSDNIRLPESSIMIKTEDEDFDGFKMFYAECFEVANDAVVEIDNQKAQSRDLRTGMWVVLQLSAVKDRVLEIRAWGPKVDGIVKSVDADQNTVSFIANLKSVQWTAEAIAVKKDATVIINGKEGRLTDLRPGMLVTLQMSAQPDASLVVAITADKDR